MKKVKYLEFDDLNLIKSFIIKNIEDFKSFTDLGWSLENIRNHFKKKNNFSIGYFYKNEIYGLLIGEYIPNENNVFDLEIHIIYVNKKNRRNNIGSKILSFVEKNKQLTNISKIFLEVSDNNLEAIKFYEKNNFVLFEFRHNYYRDKNNTHNALCYFKKL